MSLGFADTIGYILCGVLLAALGVVVIMNWKLSLQTILRRRRWRSRARRDLCIHCKHSLAGVQGNQCPECGKDGRLSSPQNRKAAYDEP
jgi:hypothetical protein